MSEYSQYRGSEVMAGQDRRCMNILCEIGAVIDRPEQPGPPSSLALSQHSSGKQQQHKPNPCNRVSAASTSVYLRVIQCQRLVLPAASDHILHCRCPESVQENCSL